MNNKQVKPNLIKRLIGILLCLAILTPISFKIFTYAAQASAKTDTSIGTIAANEKAAIDCSNISNGLISVKYTGGKNVNIKLQITKTGGTTYTYNLNNKDKTETFALTDGNGNYAIKVFENISGTKYAQAFSENINLTLSNEFAPFLHPNQYVNFNSNSKVVAKASALVKGKTKDIDKVSTIYNYVVKNFTYDKKRAKTVTSGYIPVIDNVLATKKGICFDYAAVMTAMLRSQDIPCKLVVGYAGKVYHAWINVYLDGKGWVEKAIYFDGKHWTLMDPTFASSAKSSPQIMKYISNESNYTKKFAY